jgi:hypothetical protein
MSTTPGDYVYQLLSRKYSDRKNHWRIAKAARRIGMYGFMIPRQKELILMKYDWKNSDWPEEEADSRMHQIADIMDEFFTSEDDIIDNWRFEKLNVDNREMMYEMKMNWRNKTILRELKDHAWMWPEE